MEDIEKLKELTPQQYFDLLKDQRHSITDEELARVYDNCLELINKYRITGQKKGIRKLIFYLECLDKEREIVKMGIDTFIYRDDIEEYIDTIANDTVKIIEIENYEREIPDEIVEVIEKVKDKFDQLYVVFTDYTGRVERQIEKERRDKDPILLGTFQDPSKGAVNDRFYYLGDWEDPYCDLTLDKLVNETEKAGKRDIVKTISTPKDLAELREQIETLSEINNHFVVSGKPQKKKTWFEKVKSVLRNEKEC